ncbi:hypothetical protein GALL_465060 [mine drainage metagenome]|uniref:Uncharacterized protein n=1 Tax=mine drainage metagenome TaxID=410659 RepID=A0A1J5Q335_9ZZZZ
MCRELHRVTHARVRAVDSAVKVVLMTFDQSGKLVRRGIGIGLRLAIGEHARSAVIKIGRRKSRAERQRRHRLALQRRQFLVDAFGRLIAGALPADRNQERQLPERLCQFSLCALQQRDVARRGAASVGHIDMGIGAVGNERICILNHLGRDVGMQVEADHQRQVVSNHLAHAPQDFTFAVVEMLGHHGAVQIQIHSIDPAGILDAVHHHPGDTLIGVFRHMGRGTGGAEDCRHQFPASGFRLIDKAGQPDIDVAHGLEHVGPLRHRRPATAMHEIGIGSLRRRKGVGLVQEAANGDTGH